MLTLTSPIDTWAHPLPAGVKLASLCGFTVLLFSLHSALALAAAAAVTAALIASGGTAFARQSAQMLRPLLPFVVIVALWHLILRDPSGVAIILRMLTAVAAANAVTMTTRLTDMISVLQALARPLAPLISPRSLALAVALTIRFIPAMLLRAQSLGQSWQARATTRPRWHLLLPLTLAALDDADHVAQALRARGGTD